MPLKTIPQMMVDVVWPLAAMMVPIKEMIVPPRKKYRRPKMSDRPPERGNVTETAIVYADRIQL